MRFVITKDFHGVVECVKAEFGLDDSAHYLCGTRYFNETTKSWMPVFYNLERTYKGLESLRVGERVSKEFSYEGIGMGELDYLTIKRVA